MKRIFITIFSLSALASSAGAINLSLTSGVGYGYAGIAAEFDTSGRSTAEIGVGASSTTFSIVGGGKFFFNNTAQGPYLAGRGFTAVGSGALLYGGVATLGYRASFDRLNVSAEIGAGLGTVTNGSATALGFLPAFGLSVGYRF
ncbi:MULTISPECIES: hypothetical protein [Deinococcus]|uniref:Outer membrane protein beta-barrel domain-containing protein n=1 Tax=Deinococcus geothermalis (strain DSM 11300 / CIP 105573 / AG-3a) TaxID=319795 RepID=Q1IWU5_DEIGD|nr:MULTISPECIES: hypothetical protein [Deinococcus]ABF46289.1 hypothetical protein Dgeo_1995 [Deinococcus geothermalis DSM 11300]MBI0444751.1 hypothetical protein [Deinococcus sp. DB0503]